MFHFILLLLVLSIGALICLVFLIRKYKATIATKEDQIAYVLGRKEKYKKLFAKYRPIHDVENELQAWKEKINQAEEKRESILLLAGTEQKRILDGARQENDKIIDEAHRKANEIAQDAIEARSNKEKYEAALRSIKNTIKGYGDEYLVPAQSILDELAEGWGHKEAGQELKKARASARELVKEGKAADCDYKEVSRKETAIKFVIDAFNGRVDAILSKVKHDNYGKLAAQIRDVFSVVNLNGEAFRNARITHDYLMVRLDELKWAVAVHELRVQEREEQREIREQMREEEKARKEFEKAQKEAEKQERELARKMKDAEQRLALAQAESEKEKLLAELEALQISFKEVEERNQRAISMAQQTKRGHVYIISNIGSFGEDVFKIGLTRRLDPLDRVKELGDASVPFPFDVHAMVYAEDAPSLENTLHKEFELRQVNKANPRKEFFRLGLKEIRQLINDMGYNVQWTMKAEAHEYHESLAKEKALANRPQPVESEI